MCLAMECAHFTSCGSLLTCLCFQHMCGCISISQLAAGFLRILRITSTRDASHSLDGTSSSCIFVPRVIYWFASIMCSASRTSKHAEHKHASTSCALQEQSPATRSTHSTLKLCTCYSLLTAVVPVDRGSTSAETCVFQNACTIPTL